MVYPALLPLMRTPRLPAVDWTYAPADLNGLVRFAERRNLVSVRVPSRFKCSLTLYHCLLSTVKNWWYRAWKDNGTQRTLVVAYWKNVPPSSGWEWRLSCFCKNRHLSSRLHGVLLECKIIRLKQEGREIHSNDMREAWLTKSGVEVAGLEKQLDVFLTVHHELTVY